MFWQNHIIMTVVEGNLHDIAQFPDIAQPRIKPHGILGFTREFACLAVMFKEELCQRHDVGNRLAEWRYIDGSFAA